MIKSTAVVVLTHGPGARDDEVGDRLTGGEVHRARLPGSTANPQVACTIRPRHRHIDRRLFPRYATPRRNLCNLVRLQTVGQPEPNPSIDETLPHSGTWATIACRAIDAAIEKPDQVDDEIDLRNRTQTHCAVSEPDQSTVRVVRPPGSSTSRSLVRHRARVGTHVTRRCRIDGNNVDQHGGRGRRHPGTAMNLHPQRLPSRDGRPLPRRTLSTVDMPGRVSARRASAGVIGANTATRRASPSVASAVGRDHTDASHQEHNCHEPSNHLGIRSTRPPTSARRSPPAHIWLLARWRRIRTRRLERGPAPSEVAQVQIFRLKTPYRTLVARRDPSAQRCPLSAHRGRWLLPGRGRLVRAGRCCSFWMVGVDERVRQSWQTAMSGASRRALSVAVSMSARRV